jgi:beta-phosphoglucomutase-like phosphatase (HAD superfamily)
MTPQPLKLVIFDCDGVLVDSEGPSNRVIAQEITKLGWPLDEVESSLLFTGGTLADIPVIVERHLGRSLPDGWTDRLRSRLIDCFASIETMPGAHAVLRSVEALGIPFRVASNSSHVEMVAKFATTGLDTIIGHRRHSAEDVPLGKPAPDVFLAAAAAEGVSPAACIVIEDSVAGTTAARAAGMAVIGLVPHGDGAALRKLGAHVVRHLSDVPPLLAQALRDAA